MFHIYISLPEFLFYLNTCKDVFSMIATGSAFRQGPYLHGTMEHYDIEARNIMILNDFSMYWFYGTKPQKPSALEQITV